MVADSEIVTIPNDRRLVVIQRNPTSGSGRNAKHLRLLIHELKTAGFRVRLFANRDRFDDFVASEKENSSIRCLVAAGGDGTISSLTHRHSEFPIATLPMGTENLMARHLEIPRCGATAASAIIGGRIRRFDTGLVNDQRFLLMASVGVDADVVQRLAAVRKGNIHHLSYAKPILQSFLNYSFPKLAVYSVDGELLCEGTHVIATNVPEYGFRMPFCPDANPHDGELDVRVFKQPGRLATLSHAVRTRLGMADRTGDVVRFKATTIEVRAVADATAAQFDGDPAGTCPIRISIAPSSMTMIVRSEKPDARR